ncbi:MAG: sigma-54-dependent Fis family transcriptional regulator, partial [Candidatus Aminicenantes bacterium]|nr:sigma-54-dependent Fis family transcriptional regulator [Candidatus Aminicenantes bacterium]
MENKINARVLIVDDDLGVLQAAKLYLKQHIEFVEISDNPEAVISGLKTDKYDVIFLDMNFTKNVTSGEEGFYFLKKIKTIDPSIEVILITAYGDVELAVKAIKEGAADFIIKPWQNEKLLATLSTAVNLNKAKNKIKTLQSQKEQLIENINKPFYNLLGNSESIKEVINMIKKISKTDVNVLITGENGTGKELVFRAIHRESNRSNEPFIPVDMGAVSDTLFESELFGHVKGAFTDAIKDRVGHFEVASGGTLFLDEIGNLPLPIQAKILRVLETREVKRLGSHKSTPIDIRLISATNIDIRKMVKENKFREDLLYRINTIEIQVPPLRDRGQDIVLLAEIFLKQFCLKYKKSEKILSPETREKLLNYRWPGNVRELKHSTERAVIMSENDILCPDDFFISSNIDFTNT